MTRGTYNTLGQSTAKLHAAGLEAYWPLHEGSGSGIDVLGRLPLENGTMPGTALGRVLGARDFESTSSQFMSRPPGTGDAAIGFGDEHFTFAVWVNKESSPANQMYILSKGGEANNSREYSLLWNNTADRFQFVVGNPGLASQTPVNADSLGAPVNGTWYFIVAGYLPDDDVIYIAVNGGPADTAARANAVSAQGGASEFIVGAVDSGGIQGYWDGLVCELSVFRGRLSAAERALMYNAGRGLTWPFSSYCNPYWTSYKFLPTSNPVASYGWSAVGPTSAAIEELSVIHAPRRPRVIHPIKAKERV